MKGGHRWKPVMVTLTYRTGEIWEPEDISTCIQHIRMYLKNRALQILYVWVAEIQEHRAEMRPTDTVLHYHLVVWLPRGRTLPMPDKQGWWKKGSTKIEWARNPVGYLAKYASKGGSLEYVPKGARLSGFGGLRGQKKNERAWWMCPVYVRDKWTIEDRPKRADGGGWLSRKTGEVLASLWHLVTIGDGGVWLRFVAVGG